MRRRLSREVQLSAWAQDAASQPDHAVPEDWPASAGIAGAGMSPLWHGSYLSSLSASFAAVNAVRLASDICLGARDEEELLAAAFHWREDRGYAPFRPSLRKSDWPRLLQALCEHHKRRQGQHLCLVQPWQTDRISREEFTTTVERVIVSRHVIATLSAGANYSLIRGYTSFSLLLFDSGGRRWISREAISVPDGAARKRHHLIPTATIALCRSS